MSLINYSTKKIQMEFNKLKNSKLACLNRINYNKN